MKPVVKKYAGLEFANDARYAPYSESKFKQIIMLLGYPDRPTSGAFVKRALIGLGVLATVAFATYYHAY
jgi:hypothetical protein